ncbi:translation initiation factor IF-3, mitochondrial isoform X3 [Schistocerca nitens]|uniref:translation initiation factor IF-3, mitochondrial isoform X3 n=1 Tax=Schistocerca nitens TaxID=7011 RepID=UPI00211818E8|nr:translation initiation factor IF-3, mitochondrial isoform X3 [Schistocerca nitens]
MFGLCAWKKNECIPMASRTIKSLCFGTRLIQHFTNDRCHIIPATLLSHAVPWKNVGFINYATKQELETNQDKSIGTKKKQPHIPKITLHGTDGSISVVSLEEAQKLSKRRDLKLLKVTDLDSSQQRPVYKLLTESQYLEEEKGHKDLKKLKKDTGFKGSKLLPLTTKIGDHDLHARLKNISKWLAKNFEVRVVISGDEPDQSKSVSSQEMNCQEKIYDEITAHLKNEGRVIQKRFKGNDLKFQILPLKKETKEE